MFRTLKIGVASASLGSLFVLPVVSSSTSAAPIPSAVQSATFYNGALAAKHAPVVFHDKDEPNKPVNAEWLLQRSSLWVYDKEKGINECILTGLKEKGNPTPGSQTGLTNYWKHLGWDTSPKGYALGSWNSWDKDKKKTYYLRNVHEDYKKGSENMADWRTYVHMYKSQDASTGEKTTTIQYWRLAAYQNYKVLGIIDGSHGGDWEGVHVVLDKQNKPYKVRMTFHTDLKEFVRPQGQAWDPNGKWGDLRWKDGHPLVKNEKGGHGGEAFDGNESEHIKQETWKKAHGGLANLGSYASPIQGFLRYSGLWGSPEELAEDGKPGGYWGPVFNETGGSPESMTWALEMSPNSDFESKAKKPAL